MIANNIEQWRLIDGYDNYEVSSHGAVRNNRTNRILRPRVDKHGYHQVVLCLNGKGKSQKVHRLVASRFCANPNNYPCVDHIDRNKLNNNFTNLRYATYSMNSRNMSIRNECGVKGICFNKAKSSWGAKIYDNNRNCIVKNFSISKYDNAKERAIEWRKQKERELEYVG